MGTGRLVTAERQSSWLVCCALAIAALAAPLSAHAHISAPECRSLADEEPLGDESGLSADDRQALATLRSMAVAKKSLENQAPPTVYNFNSLFLAISPGVGKDEKFGTRTLVVATRLDGVTRSTRHQIIAPRYEARFSVSSGIFFGTLQFYGNRDLRISVTNPDTVTARKGKPPIRPQVSWQVLPPPGGKPCGG